MDLKRKNLLRIASDDLRQPGGLHLLTDLIARIIMDHVAVILLSYIDAFCGLCCRSSRRIAGETRRPLGPEALAGTWMMCAGRACAIYILYVYSSGDFDLIADAYCVAC